MTDSNETTTARTTESLLDSSQRTSLILLAVVAPICLWAIDFAILSSDTSRWNAWGRTGLYFFFVLQIGVMGWLVGTFIRVGVLRWSIYCWLLVLINLVVVATKASGSTVWPPDAARYLGYAIVSGEVGLLIVWSVLGRWRWYWRIPFLFVGVGLLARFLSWFPVVRSLRGEWMGLLFWQGLAALVMCMLLRLFGFKLANVAQESMSSAAHDDENKNEADTTGTVASTPPQFSIFHLLVWTTTLAPLMAIARLIEWSQFASLTVVLQPLQLGICFALVSLIAIWCGLGREHLLIRCLGTAVLTYLIGSGIGAASAANWFDAIHLNRWIGLASDFHVFWRTWVVVASCFLSAMLMIFRAEGCRLVRKFQWNSFFGRTISFLLPQRVSKRKRANGQIA